MKNTNELIRKNIVWEKADSKEVKKIVYLAMQNDVEFNMYSVNQYEGSLLDEYAIYNSWKDGQKQYSIKPSRTKPRKYILIEEKYATEYSSTYTVTFTDKQEKYDTFIEQHEEEEEVY